MACQVTPLETIRAKAIAALEADEYANPYPPMDPAHQAFEEIYWREIAGRIAQGTADLYVEAARLFSV